MTSFKRIYEMIELHDNIELKTAIQIHKKFDPFDTKGKRNYLYASVYCNNFDAFKILINHPNFDMQLNKNYDWIQLIFNKYGNCSVENCRYLDELKKLNIKFSPVALKFCKDKHFVLQIINNIDTSKPYDLITAIFPSTVSTQIQNLILQFVFSAFPGTLFKDFIDSNILYPSIIKGSASTIETLIKNNIDVKTCLGIPIIMSFFKNSGCLIKTDLDYYTSKEYFYEENLLDKKWYSPMLFDPLNKMEFLINNFETFKKCFKYVNDDTYEFTNIIINNILSGYGFRSCVKFLEATNSIMHFLINLNKDKNDNFFEKILSVNTFKKIFDFNDQKLGQYYNAVTSVDKEICKVILGCILFHKYEPTEQFSNVIEKAFTKDELKNLDKYKLVIIETKKSKGK